MITKLEKILATEQSHPFATAVEKCRFKERGYVEEEYFMYGTANIYDADEDENVSVLYPDVPYVNRFLVRRPEDVSKFSGRVVIEILNATALMDLDRIWVNSWKYFMRHGDIYIGTTSKPDVIPALKKFDPVRYEKISWPNPGPERGIPENPTFFPMDPATETGLFWDMLLDLTKLIRKGNLLTGYRPFKVYLAAWSQSVSYMIRILKSFAGLPQNCGHGFLYDGYFHAGAGTGIAPINLYSYGKYDNLKNSGGRGRGGFFYNPQASMIGAPVPYIAVNTESENMDVNWAGDSDEPGGLFRAYEIPGSTHDSAYNLLDYYKDDKDTDKINMTPKYWATDEFPNNYPYEVIFNAALEHLYRWSDGIPAPHAPRILKDGSRRNLTDAFGNAMGGVRTGAIDYPVARYCNYSTLKDGRKHTLFGHIEKFSASFLKELYGSLDHYRELVTAHTRRMVAQGVILKEDAGEFIDLLVSRAASQGLL